MAGDGGFEPPTSGFGGRFVFGAHLYSIARIVFCYWMLGLYQVPILRGTNKHKTALNGHLYGHLILLPIKKLVELS